MENGHLRCTTIAVRRANAWSRSSINAAPSECTARNAFAHVGNESGDSIFASVRHGSQSMLKGESTDRRWGAGQPHAFSMISARLRACRLAREATVRLFNSACLLGVLFCSACGRTSLIDDGLGPSFAEGSGSVASGSGTSTTSPAASVASGTSVGADASHTPSLDACGGAVCSGVCTDLTADPSHCGSCATACAASQVCAAGACSDTCAAGQTACGGGCVDLSRDAFQCGHCGNRCAPGLVCLDGVCACPGSHGAMCGGACVNLDSDPNNCGGCGYSCMQPPGGVGLLTGADAGGCDGHACFTDAPCATLPQGNLEPAMSNGGPIVATPAPFVCAAGVCALVPCPLPAGCCSPTPCACPYPICCPCGFSLCGRLSCVDLTADDLNCGACGVACGGGAHCSAGKCACPGGMAYCDGACIDVQASVANCGACGAECSAGATCVGGTCLPRCPSGQVRCGTNCVDLSSTKDHCGFCDEACNGTLICVQGQCGCPPGLTDCAGYCEDLTSNQNNCGSCGMTCSEGGVCSGGACL